jgi:D-tyrosyl-tRNA(Tyr) deacylase
LLGEIGPGLAVLVAAHREETAERVAAMARRLAGLRIFGDQEGKMNLSIGEASERPEMLVVSNFTVYGETNAGRRPSFVASADFESGKKWFDALVGGLADQGINVSTGEFGADMQVSLINDGPVTVIVET